MKLDGRQIGILLEAMLQAFTRASLTRLVRIKLQRSLSEFVSPTTGNLDAFFQLIDVASREGWIGALMEAMKTDLPGNQQLQSAIDGILAVHISITPGVRDPHAAFVIGRRVLMNRDDLRSHMKHFTNAGPFDSRLVVITGPDASGKTYTAEFVKFLSLHFGLNSPVFVGLRAWPGAACTPDDLMTSIGNQLGFDMQSLPPDDEAQGARRAIKLKDWLVGKTRTLSNEVWIVLDDLDDPGIPNDTLDLVTNLSMSVARNEMPKLRMILLGYEKQFPPNVRRDILFEKLVNIDDATVRLHTKDLVAQYLTDPQLIDDEGHVLADAALQNIAMPFDRDRLAMLSDQLENAVMDFLDRI